MSRQRILASGDNHRDTESLAEIITQTREDRYDFIIQTGDITNASKTNLQTKVKQLRAVEPDFEELSEMGILIRIFGNLDKERSFGGEASHVTDEYKLEVGHPLPDGGSITVDGQRFASDSADADTEAVLLTHWLSARVLPNPGACVLLRRHTPCTSLGNISEHGLLAQRQGVSRRVLHCGAMRRRHEHRGPRHRSELEKVRLPGSRMVRTAVYPERFGCGLCKFGTTKQFIPIARSGPCLDAV